MTETKARDLSVGDVFRLHVYGEVLAVASVAGGRRIKVRLELENQGRRDNSGGPTPDETRKSDLEFTDAGHTLEFLCLPGRAFRLIERDDDGEDDRVDGGPAPIPEDVNSY